MINSVENVNFKILFYFAKYNYKILESIWVSNFNLYSYLQDFSIIKKLLLLLF